MNIFMKKATELLLKELGTTALLAGVAAAGSVIAAHLAEKLIAKFSGNPGDELCDEMGEGQMISLEDLLGPQEEVKEAPAAIPAITININSYNKNKTPCQCDSCGCGEDMVEFHSEDCDCPDCHEVRGCCQDGSCNK
jgi:hypothetical protein